MQSPMPARRLEDRIRQMCDRLLSEKEPNWTTTAHELQAALQQHVLRMANTTTTIAMVGKAATERRRT